MGTQRICSACGCALSEQDERCPLCGEPAKRTASSAPAHAADAAPRLPRRKLLAIAAAAVAVAGCLAVGVGAAWTSDMQLKEQASQIGEDTGELVEVRPSFQHGAGGDPGNLAGGGIVADQDDVQFLATSDGVYRCDIPSPGGGGFIAPLAEGGASSLNACDGKLYYLSSTSGIGQDAGQGGSLCKVEDSPQKADAVRDPSVLYRAGTHSSLDGLAVHDGWAYFVEQESGSFAIKGVPCDASSGPQELARFEAERCWLFVEGGTFYVATTDADSWRVARRDVDAEGAPFAAVMDGAGRLETACLSNGAFYYAVDEGTGSSALRMRDERGSFKEYPEVLGPVRIAAAGDIVAAVTAQGLLMWVDGASGFVHDESWIVSKGLDGSDPRTIRLGVFDDWLCARNEKGSFVQLNINSGNCFAAGPRLAESGEAPQWGMLSADSEAAA